MTRAVRDGLPMIRQLRESGITWAAIAAAMSAQGLNPGCRKPLTRSRLTAIVGQVEHSCADRPSRLPFAAYASRSRRREAAARRDTDAPAPVAPSRPRRHPSPTAPHTPAKRRSACEPRRPAQAPEEGLTRCRAFSSSPRTRAAPARPCWCARARRVPARRPPDRDRGRPSLGRTRRPAHVFFRVRAERGEINRTGGAAARAEFDGVLNAMAPGPRGR